MIGLLWLRSQSIKQVRFLLLVGPIRLKVHTTIFKKRTFSWTQIDRCLRTILSKLRGDNRIHLRSHMWMQWLLFKNGLKHYRMKIVWWSWVFLKWEIWGLNLWVTRSSSKSNLEWDCKNFSRKQPKWRNLWGKIER
jgi:hypothetical protein